MDSTQVVSASVQFEEDEASGGQETSVHKEVTDDEESSGDKEASSDEGINNEKLGDTICIFCDKNRKIRKYRVVKKHACVIEKLRNDIFTIVNACMDNEMERKLEATPVNSTVYYHNRCKKLYLSKAIQPTTPKSSMEKRKQFHRLAYADICDLVEKRIIKNKECCLLQLITDFYNEILEKFYVQEFKCYNVKYTSQHLLEKLTATFGKKIQVIIMKKKRLIAPTDGCVITDETFSNLYDTEIISRAALTLRKKILLLKKRTLSCDLKVTDIIEGECEIPKDLTDFMRHLLCGIDSRSRKSYANLRKVDSFSQDLIYAIHHGKIKTSKHMTLGITLKSITSSRKVLDLLNKYGHCCSYKIIKKLETEVTATTCSVSNISPENAILAPKRCTGVAYDNYDRFVETSSGQDTLHDTVGIFYPNIEDTDIINLDQRRDSTNNSEQPAAKRRRSLDPIYDFVWFKGQQLPSSIEDIIMENDNSKAEEDEEDKYDSDEDPEYDDDEMDENNQDDEDDEEEEDDKDIETD
ncbi:PREDICTED: uncharacterized protein LOC107073427 isoform X2 [Polistes dominula]|nr:PREDICTED: uncharacterized protein LOC107073427 isoform X2 [Polistes dominula]